MNHYSMNDDQYLIFAIKNLIPQESQPKTLKISLDQKKCSRRSELMVGIICEPHDKSLWSSPPSLDPNEPSCDLIVSPDFSYWLTLEGFDSDDLHVPDYTHVVYRRMICPYFTVAIASKNHDLEFAKTQVMTFGALALYNRYRLWQKARNDNVLDKAAQATHYQIRHYALTVAKSVYIFWSLCPKFSGAFDWIGCTMKRLIQSELDHPRGVIHFAEWMNEIHRWGLTDYFESCQRDFVGIKRCRVSNVSDIVEQAN